MIVEMSISRWVSRSSLGHRRSHDEHRLDRVLDAGSLNEELVTILGWVITAFLLLLVAWGIWNREEM